MNSAPHERKPQGPQRRRHVLLLLGAVLLTYMGVLSGGFVWTDHIDLEQGGARIVADGSLFDAFRLTTDQLRESRLGWVPASNEGGWRPLAILFDTVAWRLTGGCASCLHAISLALHATIVIALYALGRRVLARRRNGKTLAFWAAVLFAIHPLNTVTVAFLGHLDLLLGTALGVATLAVFARLPAISSSRSGSHRGWLLALPITGLGAMLSHESTLILPVLAGLLAGHDLGERGVSQYRRLSPTRWLGLAMLAACVILYLGLRWQLVGVPGGLGAMGDTPGLRLATTLDILGHDLANVLLPGEPTISDSWPAARYFGPAATLTALGLAAAVGAVFWGLKQHHPIAIGVAWFLLWAIPQYLLPSPVHWTDDARLYPAAWGLLFALVLVVYRLSRPIRRQFPRGADGLLWAPIALLLGIVTALSTLRFDSDIALFSGEIDQDPYYVEGRIWLARDAMQAGEPVRALHHATLAADIISRRPGSLPGTVAEAWLTLGEAQLTLGLYAEAVDSFVKARERVPERAAPWFGLGRAYLAEGAPEAAVAALQAAHVRNHHLPDIQGRLGEALLRKGDTEHGLALVRPWLAQGGGDVTTVLAVTDALVSANRPDVAIEQLRMGLRHRESARLEARLAHLYWQQGDREAAQQAIHRALQQDSDNPQVQAVASEIGTGLPALSGSR